MPYKNPEKARARATAYSAAHGEERHAYYAAHLEKWSAADPEKHRAAQAAWRAAHPEKHREYAHRRRALLRRQFVAPVDAQLIYARDRGRCHICRKRVKQADASMDHLIPISLGGIHAPWNVRLAHLKCNLRRNNRGAAQAMLALELVGG